MEERVRIEKKDGIADVRMVRVDKMNAMDMPMFAALTEAGIELSADHSVRAVVLSGEGRAFCSGLDIPSLMTSIGSGERQGPSLIDANDESPANYAQRAAWIWQEVPVPVIAAVHGVAYGAGFQVAMGADLRFVAPDARLSLREAHWGLIPDVGVTQALRGVVPLDVLKELTFTAKVVSGAEAKEMRLATHVVDDPYSGAMELAAEIATRSPSAVRAGKQLWNEAWMGSRAEGFRLETDLQKTLMGGHNQIESVKANMEKRPPVFEDPE